MTSRVNTFKWFTNKETWSTVALPKLTELRSRVAVSKSVETPAPVLDVRIVIGGIDSKSVERQPLLTFYMADGYLFMGDHEFDTIYNCDCSLTHLQMTLFEIDKSVRGAS